MAKGMRRGGKGDGICWTNVILLPTRLLYFVSFWCLSRSKYNTRLHSSFIAGSSVFSCLSRLLLCFSANCQYDKAAVDVILCPQSMLVFTVSIHPFPFTYTWPLYANMMSSIEPEVHNASEQALSHSRG